MTRLRVKILRARTSIDLMSEDSPRECSSILKTYGYYRLKLRDQANMDLIAIDIAYTQKGHEIIKHQSQRDTIFIKEIISNESQKDYLYNLIGVTYEKCSETFFIVDHNKVIAQLYIDDLHNHLRIKTDSAFKWCITRFASAAFLELHLQDTKVDEVLDCLCINRDKVTMSECAIVFPMFDTFSEFQDL